MIQIGKISNYIPIITFVVVILIGFLVGLISGWKGALFFLLGNVGILVIAYFALESTLSLIKKIFPQNIVISKIPISKFVKSDKLIFQNTLKTVALLMTMLIGNFKISIFYSFLSRIFTRRQRLDKSYRKSILNRIIGGLFSIISALPFAIIIASCTTILSAKPLFGDFLNWLLKFISLGKIQNLHLEFEVIKNIANNYETMQEQVETLKTILIPKKENDVVNNKEVLKNAINTPKKRETMKFLLTNKTVGENIDTINKILPNKIWEDAKIPSVKHVQDFKVDKPLDILEDNPNLKTLANSFANQFTKIKNGQEIIDFLKNLNLIKALPPKI